MRCDCCRWSLSEPLLTEDEAAALLNIGKTEFDRLVQANKIRLVYVGKRKRFTREDLGAYVNRNTAAMEAANGTDEKEDTSE